jgi:ABC-type transport system involved in Fe-S cluster assembly fused permease/ATPase subunit
MTYKISGLYLSAVDVINGDADTGEFVSVNLYIVQLFTPLSFLGTVYNSVITAFVDMRNLGQLLAEKPEIVDAKSAQELVTHRSMHGDNMGVKVEFKNVKFHYPTQPPENGLQGVTFSIDSGQTMAVVGHTGAGKTTLSRLLFRFYDAHQGEIRINGQNILQVTQKSLRQNIGIVPQDSVMFNERLCSAYVLAKIFFPLLI